MDNQEKNEDKMRCKKRIITVVICALAFCVVVVDVAFASGWNFSPNPTQEVSSQEASSDKPVANKESSKEGRDKKESKTDDASKKSSKKTKEKKKASDGSSTKSSKKKSSGFTQSSTQNSKTSSIQSSSSNNSVSSSSSGSASSSSSKPKHVTVSVYIDSSRAKGYPTSLGGGTVTLRAGSSVYDALCATGVSVGGSSKYVSSIGGLAEFACGKGSGWLYFVNGSSPGYGCGSYILKGGENITWIYTCDMGNDL